MYCENVGEIVKEYVSRMRQSLQKSIPNDRRQALKSSDVNEAVENVGISQLGEYTDALQTLAETSVIS